MLADAQDVFSDTTEGAESITYYPGGHLYDPRSIVARLRRNPPDVIASADGEVAALSWRIRIAKTLLPGITPREGVDLVDLPLLPGETMPRRFRIDRVLNADQTGSWVLGVLR